MRSIQTAFRCVTLLTAVAVLMLPGSAGRASDTDLFRTSVPPNILLMVDNSSSMTNSVVVAEYEVPIEVGGVEILPPDQTDCTFFQDTFGASTKIKIHIAPVRARYKTVNGDQIWVHGNDSPSAFMLAFPVLDPSGTPLFHDVDRDSIQDAGEFSYYYKIPDPASSDADWNSKTGNQAKPVKDFWGNPLWYDANGDGVYDAAGGDRYLYYHLKADGSHRGSRAKIISRIQPVNKAAKAGVDLLDLTFTTGAENICGIDARAAGWSLWDGGDPLAAVQGKTKVVQIRPKYLDWLFSVYGAPYRAPVFEPTAGNDGIRTKSSCVTLVGVEGPTYETYRRSRIQALTQILRRVICEVNQVGDVRFGFAQFRYAGKGGDDNGGYVAVPINDWFDADGNPNIYELHGITASHEEHLRRVIRFSTPDAQTPLAEALFQLYGYFMSREVAYLPNGRDWEGNDTGVRFPVYDYDTSLYNPLGGWDDDVDPTPPNILEVGGKYVGPIPLDPDADADAGVPPDPILYSCQKNFVLYITDGQPSGDDFTDNDEKIIAHFGLDPATYDTHTNIGFADFWNLIGDHYRADEAGTPDETEETAGTNWKYLDDVAYFMNRWDFRPDENDMPGIQTIDIYTVGYALEGGESGDLSSVEKAALRGNGQFFESADADELAADIVAAITDMIDKAQSFTSATVPASRTTDGNNFYSSFFLPDEGSAFWEGHLKNFEFSAAGEILTPDGKCATGNDIAATPPCPSGTLRTFETGFWDAAEEMPDPVFRNLYLEVGAPSIFSQPPEMEIPVGQEALAALAFNLVDGVDNLEAPYDALSPNGAGDMAVALVDVLRGCEFGSDPCVTRVNEAGEKIYLGDIFHSNPVVVGSPNSPLNEPSYHVFAMQQRERTRVIYAGANDAFLHAFNAGDWQEFEQDGFTPLVPPRHDRGTGEELFGFMPYAVRNVIKELPKQNTFPRAMETVDGSPVVADTWFYRGVSGADLTSVNRLLTPHDDVATRWRTVLLGGLRNGGQSYYALDVTEPTSAASDVSIDYPRYLWGFPCEECSLAENGATAAETTYMGFTWSEPVITRVRVAADGGSDPRGYDRWVAIFGAGYHPHGDPNGSDYKQAGDAGFTPKGRGIYMLDITTGEVLAKKVFDAGASALSSTKTPQEGIAEFHYAFASAPAVFDIDFDGYADVIYIGDLGGNVWKWVVTAVGDDPINNGAPNNDVAQPNWPFRRIFRAETSLEPSLPGEQTGGAYDLAAHYQSFFFPPTGVLRQGRLLLAFGAGERANAKGPDAEYGDNDASNNNHYYVLKDANPLERGASDPHGISDSWVEGNLQDLDVESPPTCSQMQATKQGYYITARDAEKFITNSIILFGTVFTGSFMPPNPNNDDDVCAASGSAFFYAFDVDCGTGLFPGNPGTVADTRRKAIGSGIPTRPRVSVGDLHGGGGGGGGGGPCANRVVVITSDGYIENDCPGSIPSSGIKVRSWRER